jgi:hypothetical protein
VLDAKGVAGPLPTSLSAFFWLAQQQQWCRRRGYQLSDDCIVASERDNACPAHARALAAPVLQRKLR